MTVKVGRVLAGGGEAVMEESRLLEETLETQPLLLSCQRGNRAVIFATDNL
jgi:hypothetical protein